MAIQAVHNWKTLKDFEDNNKKSILNVLHNSESQYSSQSSELVDYGTSPDTSIQSFEVYDWEQHRMIRYRMNDKGGIEPQGYDVLSTHMLSNGHMNRSVIQFG